MAGSKHGSDPAIIRWVQKTGGTLRRNHTVQGSLVVMISSIVMSIFFWKIKQYANAHNCGSVFWDYISDSGIAILCAGIGLIASLVSCIDKVLHQKSKEKVILKWGGVLIYFSSLVGLCLCTLFKVQGRVEEQEEVIAEQGRIVSTVLMESGKIMELVKLRQIVPYVIDSDLYMDKKPLEAYYDGKITDVNTITVMVEILYRNLDVNTPRGSKSKYYIERTERADFEYATYVFQKRYTDKEQNDSEEWFSRRIESLQNSLEERKAAEDEYNIPANERPLATGFKEKGDECFSRNKQGEAMEAYEESAEWYMRAIYHAAAMKDYQEMNNCMELFKKMEAEVLKLDKIDSDRKNKIGRMIDVYEVFVNYAENPDLFDNYGME